MCAWLQTAAEALQIQIDSRERSKKPVMGIVHGFFIKTHQYCQADPQIQPKVTNSRATLAQITCVDGRRQLQKRFKVKLGSQARIMTTGMGIVHDI